MHCTALSCTAPDYTDYTVLHCCEGSPPNNTLWCSQDVSLVMGEGLISCPSLGRHQHSSVELGFLKGALFFHISDYSGRGGRSFCGRCWISECGLEPLFLCSCVPVFLCSCVPGLILPSLVAGPGTRVAITRSGLRHHNAAGHRC